MTTVFEALREDHDTQRTLMDILVKTEGASEGREEVYPRLKKELESHAFAEEKAFYSVLMARENTVEKARHSVAEHKEIDDVIEQLEGLEHSSPQWLPTMKKLQHLVEHHLDEEEHEVFQMAGKVLNETEKTSLASEYRAAKEQHE